MEYISPKRGAKRFTCPHCKTVSFFESTEFCNNSELGHCSFDNYIMSAKCATCGRKVIWLGSEYIYPDIKQEEPNSDMPESVLSLYKEAGLIYNKSPRAACALLRLAIDRLCNELGKTDRDINNNIAALVEDGLPKRIQQALDIVRVVGNKAVHPGQIDFDVDDVETARMLFMLINKIVESLITEPREFDEMYGKLPESTRNAIEKRDK